MHIVHVVESINQGAGGQATAVAQIARAVAAAGFATTEILAFDLRRLGQTVALPPAVERNLLAPGRPHLLGWSRRMRRAIDRVAAGDEVVVHLHSLWRFPFLWASRVCARRGIPYVASPHGSLQDSAWARRRGRKRLFWRAFRRALTGAAALCATSEREASSLRSLLPGPPVTVVPLGIDPAEFAGVARQPASRRVVFLSRLHPIKGLPNLLAAWAALQPPGWTLSIAGPEEDGTLDAARRLATERGISASVEFLGPLYGADKLRLLASAEVFVLPTLGENFGLVVAEALAAGTPVITTRGAPWEDLVEHRCGWWIEIGVEPLVVALREALALTPEERLAMGRRGAELVRSKYDLASIGKRLAAVYRAAGASRK